MNRISNKESIKILKEYFCTHADKETLALVCASLYIDISRFMHIKELDAEERKGLIKRTKIHIQSMITILNCDKKDWQPLQTETIDCAKPGWKEKLSNPS
jgi:hypothetical protein